MPRAQIKNEKAYRTLRRKGNREEKSARIANGLQEHGTQQVLHECS